jgi:hypothetical protein
MSYMQDSAFFLSNMTIDEFGGRWHLSRVGSKPAAGI